MSCSCKGISRIIQVALIFFSMNFVMTIAYNYIKVSESTKLTLKCERINTIHQFFETCVIVRDTLFGLSNII